MKSSIALLVFYEAIDRNEYCEFITIIYARLNRAQL